MKGNSNIYLHPCIIIFWKIIIKINIGILRKNMKVNFSVCIQSPFIES
jgi:hypothetical protein